MSGERPDANAYVWEQDRADQVQDPLARKRGELAVRYPDLRYCATPGCETSVGLEHAFCPACMRERELHKDAVLRRLQLTMIRLWNESKGLGVQAVRAHAAYPRAKERYQARREQLLSSHTTRQPLAS